MMEALAKYEPAEVGTAAPVDPMTAMIERIATDPNADISKLERMLEMKERLEAEQAKRAFNEAFSAAQAEIPTVLRNRKNSQTNSRYADLAAIERIAMPVVTKHGLSVRFFPTKSDVPGHYAVECVVSKGGHSETYHADVPADATGMAGKTNKTATHAFGSTMTYGRRYLLCMIFNIATSDDDDGNAAGSDTITEEQFARLRALVEQTGGKDAAILATYEIDHLGELPARYFRAVETLLVQKAARQKKEANNA